MPIGADLVLRQKPGHEAILNEGKLLGEVIAEAARRFKTPLALSLMDLAIEKEMALGLMGVPRQEAERFLFRGVPAPAMIESFERGIGGAETRRFRAQVESVAHVSRNTGLTSVGMAIGPFSLTVKLLEDAITSVYAYGTGMSAGDSEEVAALEKILEISLKTTLKSVGAQIDAGAHAVCIAEPAGSIAYVSPKQMRAGSDAFRKFVVEPNLRVKELVESKGADLFFHCCGELSEEMVVHYGTIRPAVLSLGSSRNLWKDAALVPKDTVLFGNLPSKRFPSDNMTIAEVRKAAEELLERMRAADHPFILGTECDVLSVPGKEKAIMEKVDAFISAAGKSPGT